MSGNSEDYRGLTSEEIELAKEVRRLSELVPKVVEAPSGMLYPHNALEAFGNGCLLDLRVRLAIEFLKAGVFDVRPGGSLEVDRAAGGALDIAAALLRQGTARGWVEPLPEGGELDQRMRDQARRTSSFQVLQQLEGQKFAQAEAASQIVPMAPRFPGPRGH